ncbi:hypothetical protein DLM75_06680 [Leptospira stimsonii]|uniref:Uncharacterized protein n=1 Tax=Leptospira stimsonii TaxID=2202203 RepID=A0A396ZEA9_9LEPT|nr:hypothetical protein DLM75_06680 [Leptospira stimsonii]
MKKFFIRNPFLKQIRNIEFAKVYTELPALAKIKNGQLKFQKKEGIKKPGRTGFSLKSKARSIEFYFNSAKITSSSLLLFLS